MNRCPRAFQTCACRPDFGDSLGGFAARLLLVSTRVVVGVRPATERVAARWVLARAGRPTGAIRGLLGTAATGSAMRRPLAAAAAPALRQRCPTRAPRSRPCAGTWAAWACGRGAWQHRPSSRSHRSVAPPIIDLLQSSLSASPCQHPHLMDCFASRWSAARATHRCLAVLRHRGSMDRLRLGIICAGVGIEAFRTLEPQHRLPTADAMWRWLEPGDAVSGEAKFAVVHTLGYGEAASQGGPSGAASMCAWLRR